MEETQRIQSPSSILTYKQCPRKYYHQYIEKLKTKPSIHLIRGRIVHTVLEEFFKINIDSLSEDFKDELKIIIQDNLNTTWENNKEELNSLGLTEQELKFYKSESEGMVFNWITRFTEKIQTKQDFKKLKPITELHISSESLRTRGFIDSIQNIDNSIIITDYKTSKKFKITNDYKLQLAIYALLYKKKYGITPSKVGIDFLKHDEVHIDVNQELLDLAKKEIELIHLRTISKLQEDYTKKPSPLCKWSTGQCDFYEICKPF